jgi:hypothetical protein
VGSATRLTKLAVAVVHGVGSQKADFAKAFASSLKQRFATEIQGMSPAPADELQVRGVYWANVLADKEAELETRLQAANLDWDEARNIMVDLGGDALAYQLSRPLDDGRISTYEAIHITVAGTLRELAVDAGGEAPLCIVAHSLGSVIASNYLWDLQTAQVPAPVRRTMNETPLELGTTLVGLYTMGSPIAIWSLRFPDFGTPITFPPPARSPSVTSLPAAWLNLFDPDDVIGYPLKCLNDAYDEAVTEDRAVNVGGLATMWNPGSHVRYWKDGEVVRRIATGLAQTWRNLNS